MSTERMGDVVFGHAKGQILGHCAARGTVAAFVFEADRARSSEVAKEAENAALREEVERLRGALKEAREQWALARRWVLDDAPGHITDDMDAALSESKDGEG